MTFSIKIILINIVLWVCVSCEKKQSFNSVESSSETDNELYRLNDHVGSTSCAECHQEAHSKWKESHHFHAMELPDDQTVRADFNNSIFVNYGVTTKFFRQGDKYLVETENQSGDMEVFEVAYTFGWEPLQQYLVKFPDGRMQVLPTCWDVEKKEWYHLYPDEKIAPSDPLFWTRSLQNWDHMCADCHSTNLRKKFDNTSQSFSTAYSEINVSCESCHGPGREHVELARRGSDFKEMPSFALADVNSTNIAQIETCAKCHARRSFVHPGHHAGSSFLDHFLPEVVQPWSPDMQVPTYHVDGQIDDEVYVYGSYVQSKMFHQGVKCVDCHDPHTVKLHTYDNQLCTRCHVPNDKNPLGFDSPSHHFHPMGTEGAKCVECHMPHKTYMGIDDRRDHSIRIPRPDLSVRFGSPNACNQCHQDKNPQWAADAITKFKGPDRAKEVRHPEAFHAFRKGRPEAEKLLLDTCRDLESPAFTRAGAMLALRRFISDISFEEAKRNLDSNQSVIRVAALSKLEGMPVSEIYPELVKVLSDPIRSVRTEAARLLSRAPHALFSPSDFKLFRKVFEELKLRYMSNLDRPESNLSLGILAENQNLPLEAEKHYRQAIRREDTYVPARMNLATLLSRRGKSKEAESFLREAARLQPTWGQIHYSLGLLLAEDEKRIPEAIRSLERASAYWQENPRVFNNLAIAYWKNGKVEDAINSFRQAIGLQPDNPEFLQNLVQLLLQSQKWNEALPYAEKIVQLVPNNPQYISWLSEIKGQVFQGENSK
ncbi:MAG: ammonia-forming cytochrome c nitrite reductase subunit c552 [Opitutales bacterium]|nr:ammonia-forming cytochrome c nitrite reductase subunit c552 [Opitutales bacterium]